MKKARKMVCLSLLLAMVVSTNAYAASISATLNSSSNKVSTTFNSGGSGYHRVLVSGWEYHSGTKHYNLYSEYKSVTGSGTLGIDHSAHAGYKFLTTYSNRRLMSTVYLGGSYIGQVRVTK